MEVGAWNFSQFVLALGAEKLAGAVVIGVRHKDVGGAIQVAVVRRGGVGEFLRGGNAVPLQHRYEQFRFDDRAGEEQFHTESLTTDGHG